MNVKETIIKFHPNSKGIAISSPVAPTDQKETNDILKKQQQHFKTKRKECHFSQHFRNAFAKGWPAQI